MEHEETLRRLYLANKLPSFVMDAVYDGLPIRTIEIRLPLELRTEREKEAQKLRTTSFGIGMIAMILIFIGVIVAMNSFWLGLPFFAVGTGVFLWSKKFLTRAQEMDKRIPELPAQWCRCVLDLKKLIGDNLHYFGAWLCQVEKKDNGPWNLELIKEDAEKVLRYKAQIIKTKQGSKVSSRQDKDEFEELLQLARRFGIIGGGAGQFFAPDVWFYQI